MNDHDQRRVAVHVLRRYIDQAEASLAEARADETRRKLTLVIGSLKAALLVVEQLALEPEQDTLNAREEWN